MQIWVDADACPRAAKDLVFRAAIRWKITTRLVANSSMRVPRSTWITIDLVDQGFDLADDFIAANVAPGDVVVTADIPLAARIVDRGALGIDPRGLIYSDSNVKERLASRNLLNELREAGNFQGGPRSYGPKDKSKFASALDQILNRRRREVL